MSQKASRRLLRALPTSAPAAATLLRCDSWLDLCRAVASQELLVSADVARPLLCALCLAAKGDDAEGAAAYVRHLVQPSVDRLQVVWGWAGGPSGGGSVGVEHPLAPGRRDVEGAGRRAIHKRQLPATSMPFP